MSEHALILTSNIAYLPGINAILNGLDYYGNEDLDVHILFHGIESYIEKVKEKFTFKINPYPVAELFEEGRSNYFNFKYCKYKYIELIKDKYSSVCHLDADCLILDNIMKYFVIASKTDLILCGQYPHTWRTIECYFEKDLKEEDIDIIICSYPLANFPVFYNPKTHMDLMKRCWDTRPAKDNEDRRRNRELYTFNKALYEMKKLEYVLPLPGNLWISDSGIIDGNDLRETSIAGKRYFYTALNHRIHNIHNKWWKMGAAEGEIKQRGNNPIVVENIKKIQKMLRLFNYEWKVNLKDVWDEADLKKHCILGDF